MASLPSNKRSRTYNTSKNHWVEDLLQPATKFSNMLDPSTWVVGSSGSQTGFTEYGLTAENSIIEGYGPEGTKVPLWVSLPDGAGAADGGWTTAMQSYDPSKSYRFSVFFRRTGGATGAYFFGLDTNGVPEAYTVTSGIGSDNAYFTGGTHVSLDGQWRLCVGYLLPHAYAGTVAYGGNYDLATGVKDVSTNIMWKSNSGATTFRHRSFLNGSTDTADRVYQTRPRIDLVDGTEPPLALMLAHTATFTADYVDDIITGSDGSGNKIYVQATRPAMANGDYWIDYTSGENRVFYQDSEILVELSPHMYSDDPLAPSELKVDSNDPVYLSEAQSGKRQLRSSGPQRYEATISYPPQTRAEFRKLDSFISYIRNTVAPFYLSLPILDSVGVLEGNPVIKGASQTGQAIITDGWTADIVRIVADGDPFKVEGSDKIYKVVGDHDSDSTGDCTITITPKLQFTPADNAALIFVNPEMKVDLVGVHEFAVKPPELYSYEIDVIEVLE